MNSYAMVTQTPLGELLISLKLITPVQLQVALQEQQITNKRLGEILIRHKLLTFDQLDAVLVAQTETRIGAY